MKKIVGLIIILCAAFSVNADDLKLDDHYKLFNGDTVSLKSQIGKNPVYLKFWASWCLDCRRELPNLEAAYQKHHKKIKMYAVNLNINETDEAINALLKKTKLSIPIVMDNHGTIAKNFSFHGTPFHVLINAQGEVVYTTYKDDAALEEKLAQLASATSGTVNKLAQSVDKPLAPPLTVPKGISLVYFSTTWCDSYMKDILPDMASNCLNSLSVVKKLFSTNKNLSINAYVTHLWTEEKALKDYIKTFSIPYAVTIDQDNRVFRYYRATDYPTLLVIKDGKEIERFTDFSEPNQLLISINKILPSTN